MNYFDILPAVARGFKQPGRKLLPRDWEEGARMKMAGYRSVAPLRKDDAIEIRAMGYSVYHIKKRMEKKAFKAYNSDVAVKLPRAARKMLNKNFAEEAAQAEREAYGVY